MSQMPPNVPLPEIAPVIPYATPSQYAMQAPGAPGIWRDGNVMVCVKDVPLPTHCCMKCDQPADGKPVRKKFTWHHWAV